MGSIGYTKDELVGLRVVRGPDWEWDTQDGGEGFVGTVVENIQISRRVKVRWDSGQEFIYRIGAEDAHDLRVLDNSTVGVKHPGVKCLGCGQKDIAGLRWQCYDCPMPINLCTFCFTNGKHEQTHVIFQRYDRPLSDPMVVRLHSDQPRIPLKGIFSGALVREGADWIYDDEDGGSSSFGKVVPAPTGRVVTPGKVWVQWPHEVDKSYPWPHEVDKSYPYRVGLNGKMDLKIAKAGIGGLYQPDTLPVLGISKPRADEKTNDVIADPPLVVGDRVKVVVGLEELREMSVDCGLGWNAGKMKEVVDEIFIIKMIGITNNTAKVVLAKKNSALHDPDGFWLPVKAIWMRLISWLPVGAVVQVIDESLSSDIDMAHDVMAGEFGRVKQESLDGKTVDMEFFTSNGNVIKTFPVSQLEDKFVDVLVIEKMESVRTDLPKIVESIESSILSKLMLSEVIEKLESIREDLAKLLLSEVEKGSILSVQFLLKTYPDIINCQSPYNGRNSTALSVACQKGNVEMVKLLLTHKASVDIADERDDDDYDDDYDDDDESFKKGKHPIHHAVIRNHPEVLRLLLRNGASPTDTKWNSRTPLHLAAMEGHIECVRVLLEDERCDLELKDCGKDTAFELAVESSVQSVELFNLFRATGKLNIFEKYKGGTNLLCSAAKNNNLGLAKLLLSCPEGKKLACECGEFDWTPLFIACKNGHNQIAKLLVSNVDKDENGKPWGIDTVGGWLKKTPLMIVVEEFNYELIEFLVGAGANLQAIDREGDTPFHYAARLYRGKVTTFKGRHFFKMNFISWPNQETAPEIFKLYNELETKHPGEILLPHAAVICYLVAKGGIPQNITFPEFKALVGDDFLYDDEIINFFPDQLNSMSQNVGNPSQYSQPAGWSEINDAEMLVSNLRVAIRQNTNTYGCNSVVAVIAAKQAQAAQISQDAQAAAFVESAQAAQAAVYGTQFFYQSNTTALIEQENNSYLREGSQTLAFASDQDTRMVTAVNYSASSISQQQPPPSSQQQSNTFYSFPSIASENVAVTVTPTRTTAANTFAATSGGDYHLTPSDNNRFIPETTHVPYMGETISSEDSMSNDETIADTPTADPVATGSTRPPQEVTCKIEEKHFRKRKGGPAEEKTSWIIIDESGRRYSQQKTNVSDIFQCTANVSTPNKPNGSKKCKGTIDVQDLAGKIEEWKTTPGKKFTFKVRNAHEEHLPSKRVGKSTETESDVPSTSKRKKKT